MEFFLSSVLYIVRDCRGISLASLILPFVPVASFSLLLVSSLIQRDSISRDKHGGKFSLLTERYWPFIGEVQGP